MKHVSLFVAAALLLAGPASAVQKTNASYRGGVVVMDDNGNVNDVSHPLYVTGGAGGSSGGVYNASAPTLTDGQTSPLQLTPTGSLHTTVDNNGTTEGSSLSGAGYSAVGTTNSAGNMTALVQADSSAAINISTATTTQLVALSSGKKIYVSAWDVVAGGTGNITLEYGTGSNCGTGTTVLTGAYNLVAQSGISKGTGLGAVFVIPASNALCALTSAAVQMSGSVSYSQR